MLRNRSTALLFALSVILVLTSFGWAGEPPQAGETPPAATVQPAPAVAPAEQPAAPAAAASPAPAPAAAAPVAAPAEPPAIIASLAVEGNVKISEHDILAAVTSKAGAVYAEADIKRDRDAIWALGWFETVTVDRESTEAGVRVVFHVVENPVIAEITFEGVTVFKPAELLAVMKTKPGALFNSKVLSDDSRAIDQLYRSQGYILAVLLPPRMTTSGVLTLEIAEGSIEAIKVTGNTHTKDKVIRRYIRTRPGTVYNFKAVGADVGRLTATRWFDTVQQSAEVGTEPGKVILVITVVEKKRTGQATVGGGYSSVQGVIGFVDLSKDNLGGTGQSVSVRGEFGGRSSYEFYYRHPWIATPETRLNLGLYNRLVVREAFVKPADTDTTKRVLYDERRTGGSITLGRPLSDRTTAFISLRSDRVSLGNLSAENAALLTGPAFKPSDVRSITPALASDSRDNRDYPRRGSYYQLSAELAGLLGGASDFRKFSGDARHYLPLGKKNTLAFRLLGGTISGEAPYLEQFLIGGTESLRGFPTDRFVGSSMLLLNTELRLPIGKNLIGVGFVDVGDAWGGDIAATTEFGGDKSFRTHLGYGVGIRVATPIGPLRLDIGFSSEGTETHFGLAQMF